MNEILRSLIKWTEENEVIPEIYFMAECGGIYLVLKLRYHGKCIAHEFYVPGGILCLQNWDMFPMDEGINRFIEDAKKKLKEADNDK